MYQKHEILMVFMRPETVASQTGKIQREGQVINGGGGLNPHLFNR